MTDVIDRHQAYVEPSILNDRLFHRENLTIRVQQKARYIILTTGFVLTELFYTVQYSRGVDDRFIHMHSRLDCQLNGQDLETDFQRVIKERVHNVFQAASYPS